MRNSQKLLRFHYNVNGNYKDQDPDCNNHHRRDCVRQDSDQLVRMLQERDSLIYRCPFRKQPDLSQRHEEHTDSIGLHFDCAVDIFDLNGHPEKDKERIRKQ